MLPHPKAPGALTLALVCALLCAPAAAQSVLFSEVHTVAAAGHAVPIEESFAISVAGTYQITLTDLGASLTPSAPLAAVKLAITNSSGAIVGTPLLAAGSTTFSAAADSYVIHVVGTPGSTAGSGPIGLQVTHTADNSVIASFADIIAVPPQALPGSEAVINDSFSVPAPGGSYTVSIADLQLPQGQPLAPLTLLLIAQGGTTPVAILPDPTNNNALTKSVTLTTGVTYRIFAVGQTSSTATGGLFSAVVAPASGAPVYARTRAVGGTTRVGSPALSAGSYTFKLTDLATPAALAQVQAMLVLNGTPQATLLAAGGSQSVTAAAGTYDAFVFAAPTTAGSYAVGVLPQAGGAPALSVARGVAAAGGPISAYSFDTSLSAAGAYTVSAADFGVPLALTSLQLVTVQNATLLGTPITVTSGSGTTSISGASGPITLLAFSQATTTGGLFGVDIAASGAASPVYTTTQGVGTLFASRQVAITSAGSYAVTATDLGFPASFANLDVILTQGTSQVGGIFVSGTSRFTATPGNYFINFIAQPTGSDAAGTYALSVAAVPPPPTVMLSADHTQVASGGMVNLIWSSQNATSCNASGGWSGNEALSGTFTTAALTSNTTFTLTCTGPGGTSDPQSVTITVSAASRGGGGGGSVDPTLLVLLGAALLARLGQPGAAYRRRRAACHGRVTPPQ